ncbi:MAG: recombinase family protein, partial [Patescibacteria group bacterium]|nr:recombinase family protein [Patescibacteria group bacterium]
MPRRVRIVSISFIGIFRKMGSDFFKQTPPFRICRRNCLGASPLGIGFRQEIPRGFEFRQKNSRRNSAVPKQSLDCAKGTRADEWRFRNCRCNTKPFINLIPEAMIKYYIYCRKSSEDEERQVLSIEAQLTELREFAKQNNLFVVKEFYESKTAKEPGREIFNEMLGEIEKGSAS